MACRSKLRMSQRRFQPGGSALKLCDRVEEHSGSDPHHRKRKPRPERNAAGPSENIERLMTHVGRICNLTIRPLVRIHPFMKRTLGQDWNPVGINMATGVDKPL